MRAQAQGATGQAALPRTRHCSGPIRRESGRRRERSRGWCAGGPARREHKALDEPRRRLATLQRHHGVGQAVDVGEVPPGRRGESSASGAKRRRRLGRRRRRSCRGSRPRTRPSSRPNRTPGGLRAARGQPGSASRRRRPARARRRPARRAAACQAPRPGHRGSRSPFSPLGDHQQHAALGQRLAQALVAHARRQPEILPSRGTTGGRRRRAMAVPVRGCAHPIGSSPPPGDPCQVRTLRQRPPTTTPGQAIARPI